VARGVRTHEVGFKVVLEALSGGLDKLLQALVVDILDRPLRDLIARQIASKLHFVVTRGIMSREEACESGGSKVKEGQQAHERSEKHSQFKGSGRITSAKVD